MYERDIAAREMGITVDKVREGFSMLSMEVRPEMLNGHGVCHGGFIFALADTAFAYACNSRDSVNLAQSCSIEFISPARAGERLAATARQHFQANRTGLYDVTVRRADGEVVAEFRGRSYRVRGRIVRFDPYVILVEPADGTPPQLVYKSAVVSVSGPRGMGRGRRPGHGPHPRPRGGRPETAGS